MWSLLPLKVMQNCASVLTLLQGLCAFAHSRSAATCSGRPWAVGCRNELSRAAIGRGASPLCDSPRLIELPMVPASTHCAPAHLGAPVQVRASVGAQVVILAWIAMLMTECLAVTFILETMKYGSELVSCHHARAPRGISCASLVCCKQ